MKVRSTIMTAALIGSGALIALGQTASAAGPIDPDSNKCPDTSTVPVGVYTDGLNQVVGVCIDDSHKVEVHDVVGSLNGYHPLVTGNLGVASFSAGVQLMDGSGNVVVHPKVTVTPHG